MIEGIQPARSAPPKRRRIGRYIGLTVGFLFVTFVILNCSGLHFPVMSRQSDLDDLLQADLDLRLPHGAVVEKATRFAFKDPGKWYMVRMSEGDVAEFVSDFQRNASDHGYQQQSLDDFHSLFPPPPWWRPQDLPRAKGRDVFNGMKDGFHLFYSDSSGTVYIEWFSF